MAANFDLVCCVGREKEEKEKEKKEKKERKRKKKEAFLTID